MGTYPINTDLVKKMNNDRKSAMSMQKMATEVIKSGRLLSGDDLILAGFEPGERFGVYLSEANDMIAEGKLDKQSAIRYIIEKYQDK
jgi:hypothetical protein